jgi:Cu(I)/Ag(I) efflux system membrane fusion protein
MKRFLLFVLIAGVALASGWLLRGIFPSSGTRNQASGINGPSSSPKFYQSPMHPWIKSDQPGKCTICGMDLVAVYEGDAGFDAESGLVQLSSNTVQAIHVATSEAQRRPLQRTLRFSGTIDDDDSRHRVLAAYLDGRIERLHVNFLGAEVTEGQPLADIYSKPLLSAAREFLLLQSQGRTSEPSLVTSARLRLRQFGLSDAQIDALPKTFRESDLSLPLLAPMTGTVVVKDIYEGQYVAEGDRLFEIADFSTMWLQLSAYERDLPWLRLGQTVEVTTPSHPGRVFSGQVAFIDPNFDPATRATKVRVELPNPLLATNDTPRRALSHRLFAEAAVAAAFDEVLTVPRSAVLNPDGQPLLYVEKAPGSYEPRRIRLGRVGDELVEVLDGVAAGERVVTTGNLLIDAQAQLNHGVHDHAAPAAESGKSQAAPLTSQQTEAVQQLFATAEALGAALAADDLKRFNEATHPLHALAPSLAKSLANDAALAPLAESINRAAHWPEPDTLEAARARFHGFITPVTDLALRLRPQLDTAKAPKVFQCPMTKRAFPDAPNSARWLQFGGPLRNPYYGAAMLDCGTEVK